MDKSLSVMRLRLKQQSTMLWVPSAATFAFKAIPSLLEKIPEPNKTTTFLEEPKDATQQIHFEF
ncbi:hypothetical protein Bca52824_003189 [Brassica carinata]|uniref:Uncharacterized protein n=1 Tax=Brassica carinata TaxID=52824 RepID=A0A8X7WJF2_BRACI|nr:hypothetical protein Bca52824_003189 [Brassica carinata]